MKRKLGAQTADVLFISYDGLLEPLGRSQVLPYLLSIAEQGIRLIVLSFEKTSDLRDAPRLETLERKLRENRVQWSRMVYHQTPKALSTAFDIVSGSWKALLLARTGQVRIVHARSYVPALLSLWVKWLTGASFVFDMRGFWPEERVELGIFRPGGFLYHLSKIFEWCFLASSDHLVVLTERARETLLQSRRWKRRPERIEVVPCCVDQRRFAPRTAAAQLPARYGPAGRLFVGNLGAVNRRYLLKEMFQFFSHLKKHIPELGFIYLTRQSPESLLGIAETEGVARGDLVVASANPDEVPQWLSSIQLGIFFLKPSYAARASCFTKLGEFLAAGVPVVTNAGVGDVEEILGRESIGVLVRGFSEEELSSAAAKASAMLPLRSQTREACRRVAAERFSLERGCSRYLSVYRSLLPSLPPAPARELSRRVP